MTVVADPSYRILFRGTHGELLTKEQLRVPAIFKAATEAVPSYVPVYTYDSVAYVHVQRIPWIGSYLGAVLNKSFPGWDVAGNWNLVLERDSLALVFIASTVLFSRL